MGDYYKLDLDGMAKYYLVENGDAVNVTVASDGMLSTVGTNDSIMEEVGDASEVSRSDVPDEVVDKLETGAGNLL